MLMKRMQSCVRICCLLSIMGGNACDLVDIFYFTSSDGGSVFCKMTVFLSNRRKGIFRFTNLLIGHQFTCQGYKIQEISRL